MFEPGKNSKELGIDTTRAFRVVKTHTFDAGDIIYFVKESDNMDLFGLFCKDKNIKEYCHSCHWMLWDSLEYAEEYRPEFRVGDTVEKQNAKNQAYIPNGLKGIIISANTNKGFTVRWENGETLPYMPKSNEIKLISRAEEPKPIKDEWVVIRTPWFEMPSIATNKINKPNKKTFMNIIANAFKSKEDKALEGLGLGTTKELNQSGREEYVNFLFETDGKGTKEEFFAKIVEAYNENK